MVKNQEERKILSTILTIAVAKQAVDIVRPTIEGLLGSELADGRNLHLVVFVPGTEAILYEESFGDDKSTWQYRFDAIAVGKALMTQRTGLVGRTIMVDAPWLFEIGDPRYAGGVIENGLVIAASGFKEHIDEMIAWMVLLSIQGLCRDIFANIPDLAPDFFIK